MKYCGTDGSYSRVKRSVVHFNQLKPFNNGNCDRDESWIVGDAVPTGVSLPSTTKVANGPRVIILEDDVFPMNADVGAPSKDHGSRR